MHAAAPRALVQALHAYSAPATVPVP
jgi:hypothetical protein